MDWAKTTAKRDKSYLSLWFGAPDIIDFTLNYVYFTTCDSPPHINGLVQDCSNSIAKAMESLPSCTKPMIR